MVVFSPRALAEAEGAPVGRIGAPGTGRVSKDSPPTPASMRVDPTEYRGDARLMAMIRNHWLDRGYAGVKVWLSDGFPCEIKSNIVRGFPPKR